MDSLLVIGPFRGATGYDRHTREFVRQIHKAGIAIELQEYQGWSQPMDAAKQDPFFDSLCSPVQAEVCLQFMMPNHAGRTAGVKNINYTMFEADRIPGNWVDSAGRQDYIVLPNQANVDAWKDSGVPGKKLLVCPLAVDGVFFSERVEQPFDIKVNGRNLSSFGHRFLNIADLRPRKNHLGLLRSWMQATKSTDDAVLLLKITSTQENFARFQRDLQEVQRQSGLRLNQSAPIVIIASQLSNAELRALYHSADYYISMSKGEGWDLVMMEAAAAGLTLLSPSHSGYSEYIRPDDCHVIASKLIQARFEGSMCPEDSVFFEGARWWQPDELQAAEYIRDLVQGGPAKPGPRERIISLYTWERAGTRMVELLRSLHEE